MAGVKDIARRSYRRPIGNVSADAAETEPESDRLAFPEPEPVKTAETSKIELRTTVEHRGRTFTIVATGYTLDQFCDLLERRGYAPPAQTQEWQRLPDGTPICPKHHAPMRAREKQGDTWYSHNVGTKEKPVYCKGYHGKDSPGYEVG